MKKSGPLDGTNGQLMMVSAARYCLGRQTYIVGACVEWLRDWWGKATPETRHIIVRDIVEGLQDRNAGDALIDTPEWRRFAEWAYAKMPTAARIDLRRSVSCRLMPFPLAEPKEST